ncbi:sugar ABC transporter substrate-binding protein [Thermoanaerobacterium saccharolyticum]|uniref:ABC transporter substrate-binding protein n=1 Tax=Thermoanaerobacterium saccharolyticum TaxID=28896 RepID=UPI002FDB2248
MKRIVSYIISVILIASLLLSGCGSSGSSKSSKNTSQGNSSSSTKQKITIWAWDPNFNIAIMNQAKSIYIKDHPNVQIDVVEMAKADVEQKLNTVLASGSKEGLPDIVLIEDYNAQKYLHAYPGAFADLTDKINYNDFANYKIKVMTVDGKKYGVPFDSGVAGFFYRSDILSQAGFKAEDLNNITWDQFMNIGKQVKEKTGKDMISLDPTDAGIIGMALQSAGQWYFDDNGKPNLTNNEVLKKAVNLYKELINSNFVKKETGWNNWVASFNNGDVASVITGAWIIGSIKAAKDQSGKWALAPMPRLNIDSSVNASNSGGSSWYVLNDSPNKDVAIDFLKTIYDGNDEFYQTILTNQGAIGTYLPAQDGSAYSSPDPFFGGQKVFLDLSEYMKKVPSINYGMYTSEVNSALMSVMPDVYSGKLSVDDALKKAQNQLNSQIGQ